MTKCRLSGQCSIYSILNFIKKMKPQIRDVVAELAFIICTAIKYIFVFLAVSPARFDFKVCGKC
jgi:hypothetical protein